MRSWPHAHCLAAGHGREVAALPVRVGFRSGASPSLSRLANASGRIEFISFLSHQLVMIASGLLRPSTLPLARQAASLQLRTSQRSDAMGTSTPLTEFGTCRTPAERSVSLSPLRVSKPRRFAYICLSVRLGIIPFVSSRPQSSSSSSSFSWSVF